jgi:hypothetical protein
MPGELSRVDRARSPRRHTSDEDGISHALVDDGTAKVDETDALLMIDACAAFVSYLINKARSAGIPIA